MTTSLISSMAINYNGILGKANESDFSRMQT